MSTLHTVNKSPFQNQTLFSCLGHAKDGDAILMFEDGVYGAMSGTTLGNASADSEPKKKSFLFGSRKAASGENPIQGSNAKLYVLGADLAARGIETSRVAEGITIVDYDGFVDLVTNSDRTQNWL